MSTSISILDEFLSTVFWAYFSSWTFGLPALFPSTRNTWIDSMGFNGPSLFFLWCVVFYELKVPGSTNPGYWIRDLVSDHFLNKKNGAPSTFKPEKALVLALTDCLGWLLASCLYYITLRLLTQQKFYESALAPPQPDSNFIVACISEILVTTTTMLCGLTALKVFKIISPTEPKNEIEKRTAGSLVNVLSSFGSVRIMIYGMPYSGAVMNPASSMAHTFWWLRWGENHANLPSTLLTVLVVYVMSPLIGAAIAGYIEAYLLARDAHRVVGEEKKNEDKDASANTTIPPVLTPKILPIVSGEKEEEKKVEEKKVAEEEEESLPEDDDDLTDIDEILADQAEEDKEKDDEKSEEEEKQNEEKPERTSETDEKEVEVEEDGEEGEMEDAVVGDKKND